MWNLQRSLPKNAVLHWYMQYTNALDCYQVQNVLYHHYYTLNDDYYHTLLPFPTNILNYEMKNTFWIKKAGNTVTPQNSNLCSQNKAHN